MMKIKKRAIVFLSIMLVVGSMSTYVYAHHSPHKGDTKKQASVSKNNTTKKTKKSISTKTRKKYKLCSKDATATEQLDIAYASTSEAQKFDIYLPTGKTKNVPIILNIHGGAFKIGDKAGMGGFGGATKVNASKDAILANGYAYATANYRLSGEAAFPAAINDVKAVIRYLKANACSLGIDPNQIVLYGQSAGGNLVALAGTTGDMNSFNNEKLGNESYDSSVAGVIDLYGPINFGTMDEEFKQLGLTGEVHNTASSPESLYLGADITTVPHLVKQTNPETYISKDDPKFFIQAGSNDLHIPYTQGQNFAQKLNTTNGQGTAVWTLLEGEGHGTPGFESSENLKKILDWTNQMLAERTSKK